MESAPEGFDLALLGDQPLVAPTERTGGIISQDFQQFEDSTKHQRSNQLQLLNNSYAQSGQTKQRVFNRQSGLTQASHQQLLNPLAYSPNSFRPFAWSTTPENFPKQHPPCEQVGGFWLTDPHRGEKIHGKETITGKTTGETRVYSDEALRVCCQ